MGLLHRALGEHQQGAGLQNGAACFACGNVGAMRRCSQCLAALYCGWVRECGCVCVGACVGVGDGGGLGQRHSESEIHLDAQIVFCASSCSSLLQRRVPEGSLEGTQEAVPQWRRRRRRQQCSCSCGVWPVPPAAHAAPGRRPGTLDEHHPQEGDWRQHSSSNDWEPWQLAGCGCAAEGARHRHVAGDAHADDRQRVHSESAGRTSDCAAVCSPDVSC